MLIPKYIKRKNKSSRMIIREFIESWKWDLNPRPTHYECVALPTELIQHIDYRNRLDYYIQFFATWQVLFTKK